MSIASKFVSPSQPLPSAQAIEHWLSQAQTQAQQPPAAARHKLWLHGQEIGSVAANFWQTLPAQALTQQRLDVQPLHDGWHLSALPGQARSASQLLNTLAQILQDCGLCGPWRQEQLAVCNAQGQQVATIERGAVRPLGIATRAVHLVGVTEPGRLWVQQRAMNKPTNPGMWDTLMGGMVSAEDTIAEAVERETWEEAGLRMGDLQHSRHGGFVEFSRPSDEAEGQGYMRERIDWYAATVPAHLSPNNQDGEVQAFALLTPSQVQHAVLQQRFTPEAALVLAGFFGWFK